MFIVNSIGSIQVRGFNYIKNLGQLASKTYLTSNTWVIFLDTIGSVTLQYSSYQSRSSTLIYIYGVVPFKMQLSWDHFHVNFGHLHFDHIICYISYSNASDKWVRVLARTFLLVQWALERQTVSTLAYKQFFFLEDVIFNEIIFRFVSHIYCALKYD